MQNAESHVHILFFTHPTSKSQGRVCVHPILNWTGGQSFLQEGIHLHLCFQLVVQLRFLISRDAASHRAFDCGQAKTRQSVTPTRGATPKRGNPSPQLKGLRQSVGVHGEDEQKTCEKGWKWVKVGENPKMPYPPCGRSIKTYARGNNDAPSITKYGSLVRLDAQIVALCLLHCARTALRAPPYIPGKIVAACATVAQKIEIPMLIEGCPSTRFGATAIMCNG